MLCLGSMFDLLAGDLIRNLSRLHLQGTKALPLRLSRSRCGPGGAKASAPKISASCSVLGKKFELFTDTLTADGRASRFKAERLCLRSGRVAPRSQFYRKCSGLGDSLFRKIL